MTAPTATPKRKPWYRKWRYIIPIAVVVLIIVVVASSPDGREGIGRGADAAADGSPEGSATPEPSDEAADETAEPTAPPTATAEPTPTPEPTPAFAPIELSGVGDAVPRFEIPENAAAIATATHAGGANFAIVTISELGEQNDLLVNTIGSYSGTVLFDEQDGQHSVAFEVTADGPWTITIRPVTEARSWDGATPLTGLGDDVVQIDPVVAGLMTADVSHTGASNFAIIAYGGGPFGADLLVNEIGAYDGEVLIGDGTFLLEVSADGNWSITPS